MGTTMPTDKTVNTSPGLHPTNPLHYSLPMQLLWEQNLLMVIEKYRMLHSFQRETAKFTNHLI